MTSMLSDSDDLTVLCPRCRNKTSKPVGWLKEHLTFRCAHCPATLRYDRELLRLDIETAGLVDGDVPGAVTVVDAEHETGPNATAWQER